MPAKNQMVVVFVTAKDVGEAQKISQRLLEEKLAACVNIVKDVQSFFWWDGKIDQAQEALLVIKSKRALFPKIIKAVKAAHSYSVPEIIALPIIDGSKDYLQWIKETTV
jgi:periplasmic divalent cation tolerance protein